MALPTCSSDLTCPLPAATPLDPESLHIDLESISRADNLGRVLADDLLAQGAELDLSTASYSKAVAVLYRVATVLLVCPMEKQLTSVNCCCCLQMATCSLVRHLTSALCV